MPIVLHEGLMILMEDRPGWHVSLYVPMHRAGIDTVFVAVEVQQWETFHPDTQKVTLAQTPSPEHEELLDLAALHTFLNSGTVYAVSHDNMSDNAPLAAVLRY